MRTLFLLAFGGGLAGAVYTMLHGVEKKRGAEVSRPAAHFNLPGLAALLIVFGAVGYLLLPNAAFTTSTTLAIAFAGGLAAWSAVTLLMAKWAFRPATAGALAEAEDIQGQIALVEDAIVFGTLGSIRYVKNGSEYRISARAIGEGRLERGTEVVIDRLEEGVAVVEDWISVEQRL